MSKGHPNDMWRYRKRHGLTQDEMAFLLGCEDGSSVSRYEHGAREPNLRTAFASEIISGVPAHKLFSGIYEEVEQEVTQRARILSERLGKSRGNRLAWYKRKLLDALQSGKDAGPAEAA